jgi:hypothetical protein
MGSRMRLWFWGWWACNAPEDTLSDAEELEEELDPTDPDTDAGGAWDGDELRAGTEPADPDDDEEVGPVGTFYGGGGCDQGGSRSRATSLIAALLLARRRRC